MCCLPINQTQNIIKGKLVGVNLLGDGENSFEISVDGVREQQLSHMGSLDTFYKYLQNEHGDAYKVECNFCKTKFWIFRVSEPNICYSCVSSFASSL